MNGLPFLDFDKEYIASYKENDICDILVKVKADNEEKALIKFEKYLSRIFKSCNYENVTIDLYDNIIEI